MRPLFSSGILSGYLTQSIPDHFEAKSGSLMRTCVIHGFPSQAKMEGLFFNGFFIRTNPFSLTQVNDTCNLRLGHPHRRQLYLHVRWTPHLISREAGTKPSLAPDPFPKLLHLVLLPCRDLRALHLRFCDETSCTQTNMLDK